jgi:hypothetical protein
MLAKQSINSNIRIENGLEINIKKQYWNREKGDMKSPRKVSHDVMKGYAGLQKWPVTTLPYSQKPYPSNPGTAQ